MVLTSVSRCETSRGAERLIITGSGHGADQLHQVPSPGVLRRTTRSASGRPPRLPDSRGPTGPDPGLGRVFVAACRDLLFKILGTGISASSMALTLATASSMNSCTCSAAPLVGRRAPACLGRGRLSVTPTSSSLPSSQTRVSEVMAFQLDAVPDPATVTRASPAGVWGDRGGVQFSWSAVSLWWLDRGPRRAECHDLDQFVVWLEGKLDEVGVTKVVPDRDTLAHAYRERAAPTGARGH